MKTASFENHEEFFCKKTAETHQHHPDGLRFFLHDLPRVTTDGFRFRFILVI